MKIPCISVAWLFLSPAHDCPCPTDKRHGESRVVSQPSLFSDAMAQQDMLNRTVPTDARQQAIESEVVGSVTEPRLAQFNLYYLGSATSQAARMCS
jgi:hypothetical protein